MPLFILGTPSARIGLDGYGETQAGEQQLTLDYTIKPTLNYQFSNFKPGHTSVGKSFRV